jgi:hypothetical protein
LHYNFMIFSVVYRFEVLMSILTKLLFSTSVILADAYARAALELGLSATGHMHAISILQSVQVDYL